MSIEREAKLRADSEMVLPDLHEVLPGIGVGPSHTVELDAVYYDTEDLSLARSGVTLRSRTGEPGPTWTVKLPDGDTGPVLSRNEVTFVARPGRVPRAAADLVLAHVRGRPLGPVGRIRTRRVQFTLSSDAGIVATVCDDYVTADVDGAAHLFREVEVELAPDVADDELLEAVVDRLTESGCRPAKQTVPKIVHALGKRAQAAPDVVAQEVGRKASIDAVVTGVIASSVVQLISFDPGVRLGDEPEDLHQFRVAARRLRSDLRTFGPLLDPTWSTRLRDEIRWLDTTVGAVRDADVLRARLEARCEQLPAADAPAGRRLLGLLDEEATQAREAMVTMLSSDRYVALLDALVAAAAAPMITPDALDDGDDGPRATRNSIAGLVRKPWRHLRRAADALTPESDDDALHRVRILAKRCRYGADAAVTVFGDDARRFAEAVADVQTVLGEHQDTVIAEAWLRATAKTMPSARLAAGSLIALEWPDRARAREQFPKVWRKASKRSLRGWLD